VIEPVWVPTALFGSVAVHLKQAVPPSVQVIVVALLTVQAIVGDAGPSVQVAVPVNGSDAALRVPEKETTTPPPMGAVPVTVVPL